MHSSIRQIKKHSVLPRQLAPGTSSAKTREEARSNSMDNKNVTGVKVTYIETQFVTSDAAGFKDLVQRLTGRSAPLPPAPHRPLPCRPDGGPRGTTAAGAAVPRGYHYTVAEEVRPAVVNSSSSRRTPTYLEGMDLLSDMDLGDFSDLFYVGATGRGDGCYGGFPY